MEKMFNNAGPSVPGQHYMIDPLERIDAPEIETLIAQQRYFVLHAPRQTGKTTSLLALVQHLNAQDKYRACYANIEGAQTARQDVAAGLRTVCGAIERAAMGDPYDDRLNAWTQAAWSANGPNGVLTGLLQSWSENSDRPIVLMLDEIDSLMGDTLISVLRQIRAGYVDRPRRFPQAVILCGVRDVRDYRIHTSHEEIVFGGSAFNIKTESLRLGDFNRQETQGLWQQHQDATGQQIDPAIFAELWEDTWGQPWLVNALGYEVTWRDRELRDRSRPITLERYKAGRDRLIQSRATHLDQLADKLREERVWRVIEPLLTGEPVTERFPEDDLQYLEDQGLIRRKPQLTIANRIYREILPREIIAPMQDVLTESQLWYVGPDHRLDLPKLLDAFQQFFREQSEAWLDRFQYSEAGPQLLMQAFLQRIVDGGGRVTREYGLGLRRTDLFIEWPRDKARGYQGPIQKIVIELKLLHTAPEKILDDGLKQTAEYADKSGADEAYLVIFDRRRDKTWEERIRRHTESHAGRTITVWSM